MDNITHTLFALTLARTPLGRGGRTATLALVLASNAPDIDIVAAAGGALSYLRWHRSLTHGPIGIAVLGLVTAGLVQLIPKRFRGRTTQPDLSFQSIAGISMVAVLFHVLMDVPTSYGTRLLAPFDWHWFTTDWMPIVDVYLMVALAAGLLFGSLSQAARRANVVFVLMFMAANYGVRAAGHERAMALAPRLLGPAFPAACEGTRPQSVLARWPPPWELTIPGSNTVRCLVEVAAFPTLTSPFEWRVVVRTSNGYELQDVDLLDPRFRAPAPEPEVLWRLSTRVPNQWTPAVFRAASSDVASIFLGFSRFPSVRSMMDRDGNARVQFADVRFLSERIGPGPLSTGGRGSGRGVPPRAMSLFAATIQLDNRGKIIEAHLGP